MRLRDLVTALDTMNVYDLAELPVPLLGGLSKEGLVMQLIARKEEGKKVTYLVDVTYYTALVATYDIVTEEGKATCKLLN